MMRLRPYKPSDGEYLMRWLSDERTAALWKADRFSWPLTWEQLSRYYEDFTENSRACLFTALTEDGLPCGHFSFREMDFDRGCAHMGFIVIDPAARGKGFGGQMVALALRYAFEILSLNRVTLGVYDCNEAARRCYERAGFVETDRAHERASFHGEEWEYIYLAAVRPE